MAMESSVSIKITSFEVQMELAEAAKSDDDLSVMQSTKSPDHGPYIGSSIDGLRLEAILEPDLSSEEP